MLILLGLQDITNAFLIKNNDDCDYLLIDLLPNAIDSDFINDYIIGVQNSLLQIEPTDLQGEQLSRFKTIYPAYFLVKHYLLLKILDKNILLSKIKGWKE